MRQNIQLTPLEVKKKRHQRKQTKDENRFVSVSQSAFFSLTGVSGLGENGSPSPPPPPPEVTDTSSSVGVGGARLLSHSLIRVDAVRFRLPGLSFVSAGHGISSLFLLKIEELADFGVDC